MKFTYYEHMNHTWCGKPITRQQADVLFILAVRHGYVPCVDIIEHLYPCPDDEPLAADALVKTQICFIRKKFGRGCIEKDSRLGYRVVA